MNRPKAIMVPFSYPGYPKRLVQRFKNASSRFLKNIGIDLVTTSTVINFSDTRKAMEEVRGEDYDFLVVLVLSWLEAPNVIEVVKEYSHKPILLWSHTMFEEKGELLTLGPIPGVGVIRQAFEEMGWDFRFVYGQPGEEKLKREIPTFARAAAAVHRLRHCRIGLLGYASMGMYTAAFDHLALRRDLGPEVDQLDQYILIKRIESVKKTDIEPLIAKVRKQWEFGKGVRKKDIEVTLKMYLALKGLVAERQWSAVTVKCQYELSKDYGYTPCVPLSLLGNEMTCSCEGDIPLISTQLILHYLTGGITSYCDIHTVEEDRLLMGACGFAPFGLCAGKPRVDRTTVLYEGLANCTVYREGQVTIARLGYTRERTVRMHIAVGQAETPRAFREVGCLPYPSMEMILPCCGDEFAQRMMSQHYAVVYGDLRQELEQLCRLLPIEMVVAQ